MMDIGWGRVMDMCLEGWIWTTSNDRCPRNWLHEGTPFEMIKYWGLTHILRTKRRLAVYHFNDHITQCVYGIWYLYTWIMVVSHFNSRTRSHRVAFQYLFPFSFQCKLSYTIKDYRFCSYVTGQVVIEDLTKYDYVVL